MKKIIGILLALSIATSVFADTRARSTLPLRKKTRCQMVPIVIYFPYFRCHASVNSCSKFVADYACGVPVICSRSSTAVNFSCIY